MPEKRNIGEKVELKYEGILQFKPFLNKVVTWLEERGYDVNETSYSEVVKADHKELAVSFKAEKEEKPKYTKYVIIVEIDVDKFQDVLVKKGDTEKKFQSATINMTLKGVLNTDVEGKWEGKPVRHLFRNLYEKFIIGDVSSAHEKEVIKDMKDFQYAMKQFLNLYLTQKE